MQRSCEWKLQNQETNTINKAFQQSHFFIYIFPLQNQFLFQEFLLVNNPSLLLF